MTFNEICKHLKKNNFTPVEDKELNFYREYALNSDNIEFIVAINKTVGIIWFSLNIVKREDRDNTVECHYLKSKLYRSMDSEDYYDILNMLFGLREMELKNETVA